MAPNVGLRVNGVEYRGWKRVRITRGIETCANSFELEVSNRPDDIPINEEDECTVIVGSTTLITGYVDRISLSLGPEEHSISFSGRDRTADLVDCSAVLDRWEFVGVSAVELARKVAAPFGISVTLQPGLVLPKAPPRITVDPGESAFEVIERCCRLAALLPVADGRGGLLLTRAGTARATTELVQGQNVKGGSSTFDATGRFRKFKVLSQHKGSDDFYGPEAASIVATAEDLGVTRTKRVLIVRPEANTTPEHARKRAEWEATVRAARGQSASVAVQGWTQGDGTLWPVNAIVRVRLPAIRVDADVLITQAVHTLDDSSGTVTELTLRRSDAFTPQPVLEPITWKELAGGVK